MVSSNGPTLDHYEMPYNPVIPDLPLGLRNRTRGLSSCQDSMNGWDPKI